MDLWVLFRTSEKSDKLKITASMSVRLDMSHGGLSNGIQYVP